MRKVTKPQESRGGCVRFLSDEERIRLLRTCKESGNPYLYTMVASIIYWYAARRNHGSELGRS